MGSREWGVGSREWGKMGKIRKNNCLLPYLPYLPYLPIPHSPLPMDHSPFPSGEKKHAYIL
ncbi:MAG: hypothetical protein DSM106950_24080 [Stigonema ocellatum SAG 48.90 = DSM 106950]|nr:hypothetical protein [Stigonema ocellatum SAG 48.90 = DSM 106950]